VFSSGELVEATLRLMRRGRSIRPLRPAGEFPPTWDAWFRTASVEARPSRLPVQQLVAAMLVREPRFPTGYPRIGTLGAFRRLWRQDWREGPAPDRRARRLSMAASILLHVLWLQLMVLLTVASFPGGEQDERPGEDVIQVEFIGDGTPEDAGGGARQAEQPDPAQAASAARPAPAAASAAGARVAPPPPPAQAPPLPPAEQAPPPAVEPPLVVSEPVQPEPEFELVVPPLEALPTPTLPTPGLQLPTPEIQMVEVPVASPPPPVRPLPQREIAVPDLGQPDVELVERALPAPAPVVELRAPSALPAAPELRSEGPALAEREIELRAPEPGSGVDEGGGEQSAGATAPGTQATAGAAAAGGTREAGQGASPTGTTAGAGLEPAARPGALPSPRRGDDWGDSTRNVPGGQAGSPSGLFDAEGRPRLAGNTGRVGGGLPPGTITEDYEKIDRMGTWLKRPPIGYEPTSLDRFWIPHETLLEEWVRRSIKEVLIPIPGTGKRIRCTVAMLMLGGACGITDPNLLDVDAEQRPPPDVPFKRELHEDPDSL
jgi:hypothetical protein